MMLQVCYSFVIVFLLFWVRYFVILDGFWIPGARLRRQWHLEAQKSSNWDFSQGPLDVILGSICAPGGISFCIGFLLFF